jgi:diguanylate cyclase (GGDEF)-like protein/hemerythrin-like metal-binding protein
MASSEKSGGSHSTKLGKGPFGVKLLLLVMGLYMITLAAFVAGSAYLTRQRMIDDRISKLRAVVEVTETMAKLLEADVAADRLSRPQAIERLRTFIYATRYNGEDYLFGYDLDGNVLAIGNDPTVQGQNRIGLHDVKGKSFIQELIATAHNGGGTVDYWYPRKPGEPPVAKLAYVKALQPWNILIGSGVYVGDIDAAFNAYTFDIAIVVLGVLAAGGGLAFRIVRDVTASISERRSAEAKIVHLAHHDVLTNLPNRAYFEDMLSQSVWWANLHPSVSVALLLCDLDRFKEVNDTFGHQAGDVVLRVTAQRFLACIRSDDTLARLGGDEFCVILPRITNDDVARMIATRLIETGRQAIPVNGQDVYVGVSVGIALCPANGSTGEALTRAADEALYEAKRCGRNQFSLATASAVSSTCTPPSIIWTAANDVGIKMIDGQHRKLAKQLNDIAASLKRKDDPAAISAKLAAMFAYTQCHFASEERLMAAHAYTGAAAHAEIHARLLDELRSFLTGFDDRSLNLTTRFLQEWLLRHVDSADRELAEELRAKGVK